MPKVSKNILGLTSNKSKDKVAKIVKLSLLILAQLPKEILEKLKFFDKEKKFMAMAKTNTK